MKSSKRSKSKKTKKSQLKALKAKAWKLMSEFIRSKDADKDDYVNCYTCSARGHWRGFHCGHHHHGRLDFDERNLRPQCVRCNRYLHGNLSVYTQRLIEENGLDWYKKLRLDANTHPGYREEELKQIIDELKKKIMV